MCEREKGRKRERERVREYTLSYCFEIIVGLLFSAILLQSQIILTNCKLFLDCFLSKSTFLNTHMSTYTHIHTYTHTCTHAYTHAHTHTHTHTHSEPALRLHNYKTPQFHSNSLLLLSTTVYRTAKAIQHRSDLVSR